MNGSLVNHMISAPGQPEPQVGDAATVCMWSDRHPATVVEVLRFKTGKRAGQVRAVVIQEDDWKVIKGGEHDGSAEYEYTPNPDARRDTFLVDSRGRYGSEGRRLALGRRERYYDPSF